LNPCAHRFACLFLLLLALGAAVASASPAEDVLRKVRAAAGGKAIDAIRTTHANLTLSTGGLTAIEPLAT
jgi:hypothetical protein